jgi:hypothetical protein
MGAFRAYAELLNIAVNTNWSQYKGLSRSRDAKDPSVWPVT